MLDQDPVARMGAMQMRWHYRLVASVERRLAVMPDDAERAVVLGWAEAATAAAELRADLDAYRRTPADDPVGHALRSALARADAKEHRMLAAAAGLAGRIDVGVDPEAVQTGRRLEDEARFMLLTSTPQRVPSGSAAFVRRLRAALAA